MTPQQLKAMKLALEVMRNQGDVSVDEWIATEKAIKEALAEHAMRETQRLGQEIEQEPVAWINEHGHIDRGLDAILDPTGWTPLYTTPPQRTWVGLTDEERSYCVETPFVSQQWANIEAKLKEKNT